MNDIEFRHLALVAAPIFVSLNERTEKLEVSSADLADSAVHRALVIIDAVERFRKNLPVQEPEMEQTERRVRVTELLDQLDRTRSFHECTAISQELRTILLS